MVDTFTYTVSGAGLTMVNGDYRREGEYGGIAKYVHANGQIYMLRFTMPKTGNIFWYLADKDNLDKDSGDYYRIMASDAWPPVGEWQMCRDGVLPNPTITADAYTVSGAGLTMVNGDYRREGEYGGIAKYVHATGQIYMLRFTMPKTGNIFWYLADKDNLDKDSGDYYRIKASDARPPVGEWQMCRDGVLPNAIIRHAIPPPLSTSDRPPAPPQIPSPPPQAPTPPSQMEPVPMGIPIQAAAPVTPAAVQTAGLAALLQSLNLHDKLGAADAWCADKGAEHVADIAEYGLAEELVSQ